MEQTIKQLMDAMKKAQERTDKEVHLKANKGTVKIEADK